MDETSLNTACMKQTELYSTLINEFLPPCILVNKFNDIVHTSGPIERYIAIPKGKISLNLFKMLSSQLALVIGTALHQARQENRKVVCRDFHVVDDSGRGRMHLAVEPFSAQKEMELMVIFIVEEIPGEGLTGIAGIAGMDDSVYTHIRALESELECTQDNLKQTIQKLEASNNALLELNDELVLVNDELKNSNEELHTVNNELMLVNLELQRKLFDLTELNNDMDNFLVSTRIGTLFLDTEMHIRRFTPSATKLFHLMQVDIGRPIYHITHQLKYNSLLEDIQLVLSSYKTIEREVRSLSGRWYSMRILPYRTMDNLVHGAVLTFVDITELKQANTELEKLSYAIEQSPSMVMIMDVEGYIEYVNPAFTKKTGLTEKEVLHCNLREYLNAHTASPSQVSEIMRAIASGKEWSGDLKNRRKHGDADWYWESCSIQPIKNKDGEIIHYLKMSEDITEHKKTEELLRKSEMLSAVGELAAGIAHEIRNPLTALKGFVQLMKAQGGNEKYIAIMLSEFNRIEHIINELLLLSKPKIINFQPSNLLHILNDVLLLIDTQAILNKVHIITEVEDTLPLIQCVENQLKQVFINLLKNAIESMPGGGIIHVSMKRVDNDMIGISIRDEGCGIPSDKLQRLGEPFFTTKEKGTGLGMMVSFNIIEGHKGCMHISSVENVGTTVSIRLPALL